MLLGRLSGADVCILRVACAQAPSLAPAAWLHPPRRLPRPRGAPRRLPPDSRRAQLSQVRSRSAPLEKRLSAEVEHGLGRGNHVILYPLGRDDRCTDGEELDHVTSPTMGLLFDVHADDALGLGL